MMATVCTSKLLADILAFFKTKTAAYIAAIETELSLTAGTIPVLKRFEAHDDELAEFPYGVLYEMDTSFQPETLAVDLEKVSIAVAFLDQRSEISDSSRLLRVYRDYIIRVITDFPTCGGGNYQLTLKSVSPALTAKVNAVYKGIVRVVFEVEKY